MTCPAVMTGMTCLSVLSPAAVTVQIGRLLLHGDDGKHSLHWYGQHVSGNLSWLADGVVEYV